MGIDFAKEGGLVPAILQDADTGQVLMLGYMNEEAVKKTVEDEKAWFYSRSKDRLWMKGESSGHTQTLVNIKKDCDSDALLVQVRPNGPTCHLGTQSCFGDDYFNLDILNKTVRQKLDQPEEGSYTKYLKEEGLDKILKKNGEEMTEVVIAAKNQDKQEVVDEASDLLYHLLVLLNYQDISLQDVEANLADRHGVKQNYSIRDDIKNW